MAEAAPHGVAQQVGAAAAASAPAGVPGGVHLTLLVVGKVTDSSARILVEVLEGGRITAHLTRQQRLVRSLERTRPDGTVVQDSVLRHDASNTAAAASCSSATPANGDVSKHTVTLDLQPGRPRIFKFEELEPNARYALSFDGLAHAQPASSFVTMLHDWKISPSFPSMRVATISCNLLSETMALTEKQTDLWQDLADRIGRDEVDYVLHMGDQVYADEPRSNDDQAPIVSAFAPETHAEEGKGGEKLKKKDHFVFKKACELIKAEGASTPAAYRALHPRIEELYRELYRETWSHPPTAKCLANVPNLTVYDDHDFVDNWGTLPSHHDKDSVEYSVGLCARQVYYEYQASLHRDFVLEEVPSIVDDHHFHVFGEIGFAFTESRGASSFRYETDGKVAPFLGVRQWADLESALSPGGLFDKVKHLIMVCPCPVVYLPHGLNAAMEPMVEDAQGHWASKAFIPEQTRMLNLCLSWQEKCTPKEFVDKVKDKPEPEKPTMGVEPIPERGAYRTTYQSLSGGPMKNSVSGVLEPSPCQSDRRLTLVGGDVHVGGHTRLFKHGHLVMEQLVSSAIANHIIPAVAFAIASMVQNAYTKLDDGWEFNHQPFTRKRNYGLVDTMAPEAGTKPAVSTHIISAD